MNHAYPVNPTASLHRAPVPEEEPLPGEEPVPQEDPTPHPDPIITEPVDQLRC